MSRLASLLLPVKYYIRIQAGVWKYKLLDTTLSLGKRPFLPTPGGREFDCTVWSDGVGVSLEKNSRDKKRSRRQKKKGNQMTNRDRDLFLYFNTFAPAELDNYEDVVFANPNRRDVLFMMHEQSQPGARRILRHTSMSVVVISGPRLAEIARLAFVNICQILRTSREFE